MARDDAVAKRMLIGESKVRRAMRDEGIELSVGHAESFVANLMLVLCSGERVTTVMPIDLDPSTSAAEPITRPATLQGGA
jgi:hypothetical protein